MEKSKYLFKTIVDLFVILCITSSLSAKVTLPSIFTNNMVLQQQTDATLWGKASAGKIVKIVTSWDNKLYCTTAMDDGNWIVKVKTPTASYNAYSITFSEKNTVKITNILIGEVWICSGQSNMEMPLAGWGKVKNYEQEVAAANFPNIRILNISKVVSETPLENAKLSNGGWAFCSPATISVFSSVGYFFARDLLQHLDIPIGLVNVSWGGTIAEAWTSKESLQTMPDFYNSIQSINPISSAEQEKKYIDELTIWEKKAFLADRGCENGIAIWTSSFFDDSTWETMSLPGIWEKKGLKDFDGIVWFRKTINIPENFIGKELKISLGEIDDNEITYFNGVKIGATNNWDNSRVYTIPAKKVKSSTVEIAVKVTDNGGNGGLYGDAKSLFISTAGEPAISLCGDWKYQIGVDFKELPSAPKLILNNPNRPTVLYNGMIHPLIQFAMRGVIWYQGESNADKAYQYRELFPLLITDWRNRWRKDFPFYFVQLANYMKANENTEESAWAELREAQSKTLNLINTGMAVTLDIGEEKDIHPKNKQDVGIRLALLARANTYNEKLDFSGPQFEEYIIEGKTIRISFKHTNGGLKIKDGKVLKGFAVAGLDHKFYWADASILGNEVIVTSPDVLFPIAVRYAWANNPICNLINGSELPASSFRTDDWPGLTFVKK